MTHADDPVERMAQELEGAVPFGFSDVLIESEDLMAAATMLRSLRDERDAMRMLLREVYVSGGGGDREGS